MKICWWGLAFVCVILVVDIVNSTVELTLPTRTVSIAEKEGRRLDIIKSSDPISCRDTGGALTRAWLESVSPDSPCTGCFTVEPCDDTDLGAFCLVYQAGQGQFSYSAVQIYTAVIACTDDVLNEALSESLQIVVMSNLAPQFDPPGFSESIIVRGTRDKRQGDVVFTVLTNDTEDDVVFFDMATEPDTDLFTISHGSGVVMAAVDLRYFCTSSVVFRITIWDSYHNPGLPKDIQATFKDINDRPVIKNTDHTWTVAEDTLPVTAINVLEVDDVTLYPDIQLDMTSLTQGAYDLYYVSGGKFRVRRDLDYEYEPLREVSVSIRAFDGFCYSDTYDVRVVIDDVNEDFIVQPVFMQPVMFEGFVNFKPNVTIVDQDEGGVYIFRRVTGNSKVSVQSSTGLLTSSLIEVNPKDKKNVAVTVEVQDTTADPAHAHSFEINITMLDINDKTPAFSKKTYEFKVDNCTEVGKILGKVFAKDDDSTLNGNSLLHFSGGGATFAVLADGSVLYTSLLEVGGVTVGSAYVTDMGLVPEPLEGSAATVTVTCKACKEKDTVDPVITTTTEWTVPRNVDPSEILRATDTSTNDRSWQSNNVRWMAAAAALLALLVVLVGLMIWRYAKCKCCKPKPRPRQVTWSDNAAGNSGQKTGQPYQQLQQKPEQGPGGLPQQTAPVPLPWNPSQPSPWPQQQQQQQQHPPLRSEIMVISGNMTDVPMQPPSLPYPVVFQEEETEPPTRPRVDAKPPPEQMAPYESSKPLKANKPPPNNSTSKDTKQPQDTKPSEDTTDVPNLKPSDDGKQSPDNKTSKDAKPPQNNKPSKDANQAISFKPTIDKRDKSKAQPQDPAEETPQSPLEEIYHKPKMHVGEYIDLEILTPRNSPLPSKDI